MTERRNPDPQPNSAVPENPLVTAINLQQEGKVAEAEALFRQILIVGPTNPAALYSLAGILLNSNRPLEALQLARTGTDSNPGFAPLWLAHGIALRALNQREEALNCWDQALVVDPTYVDALINSGTLLHDLHRPKDALLRFNRALEISPDHPTVLGNFGILLTEFKLGQQAVAAFEHLLRVNPDYPYALGLLCYERMHHCDWTDLTATSRLITEGIREGKATCKTLALMAMSDSASDHYLCARIFANRYLPGSPAPLWRGERYQHARKRIAYVSPDLREHPVGHLMAGVIEGHDKSRFETIAISLGIDDGSRIRARMVSAFDHFIDAKDMHSLQIAELMRQMEVDIAIDLAGYTTDSRTEVFKHRPAPIQINYLGYPGTLGLDCYDYILADRTVIPEEHQAYYTEKPAYLDHCYLPVASGVEVAEPLPRTAYGLPNKGFVFCAFSHDYKIHPDTFDIWMRLLKSKPGSVLWLMSRNEVSQENLRLAAKREGVEPDRIVFATRVPRVEDHLARYRVADLFLDTWPYNAHTTAADALLAGLPVITYCGGSFPSRVASSLLKTLGLDELVTQSFEDYFELANDLAHKPKRLKTIKKKLSPEALEGHPFLGHSFTKSLERLLDGLEPPVVTPLENREIAPATSPSPAISVQVPVSKAAPPPTVRNPLEKLDAKAEAYFDGQMRGRPWIGVHVPDSNQELGSPRFSRTKPAYFSFIDRIVELNPTIGIFLLTDSSLALEACRERYEGRLLCTKELNLGSCDRSLQNSCNAVDLGESMYVCGLLALKCDYFIGDQESPISQAIASGHERPQGFTFLLGEHDSGKMDSSVTEKSTGNSSEALLDGLKSAPPTSGVRGDATALPTSSPTVLAPGDGQEMLDPNLVEARLLFGRGNFPAAEILARRCGSAADSLIEDLRRAYGMPDGYELSEQDPSGGDRQERFLIIKAWGYGFWSEGHHLASQLLLAELTQRTPIILWGVNCLFRRGDEAEASYHYFLQPSTTELKDLPRSASLFPGKWSWDNIYKENINKWEGDGSRMAAQYLFARPETIVVSDFFSTLSSIRPWIGPSSNYYGMTEDDLYAAMFQKYLKPVPNITKMAEDFYDGHMRGRPWVGVHMRSSDKVHESPQLAQTNAKYFGFIDRIVELNPTIGVFLLTDASPVVDEFRQRYGTRLLCTQAIRTTSDVGVHLSGHDGVVVGEEVFIDTLLATKCDYFIGNQESNVSMAIASMRSWPRGFLFLLGEKDTRSENLFLHRFGRNQNPTCRLCCTDTEAVFELKVLSDLRVTYFKCSGCGSLQTDHPHWLEEAHSLQAEQFDVGVASRTLMNFLSLRRLFEILDIRPDDRCADFGGGTGLFARLMRDSGYSFNNYDKYGGGELCPGFNWNTFDRPVKLVTLFDCAERFANPKVEWEAIFATNPDCILGTTGLYSGQGADWVFLSPESGQRVFFYSPAALAHIAAQRGWHAYLFGAYFFMSRTALSAQTLKDIGAWSRDLRGACNEGFLSWMKDPFGFASTDNQLITARARMRRSGTRIALDGTFFRFASGLSRLWKSLLVEWSSNGFGEFIVVLDRAKTAPRLAGIHYVDIPQHSYTNRQEDRAMLQEICDRENISFFLSTYYTTPLTTPAALLVPDMIPEVMGFDLEQEQWREKHDAIRYCRSFLSISHSTTQDLLRLFPKITPEQVVTAHCGTHFRTPSDEQVEHFKARHGIDRPYFLLSNLDSDYKNARLFFEAFERLGAERGNYLVLCTNSRPPLNPAFSRCAGAARVLQLVLTDEELQCAYSGALALAFPSRYEGFGLPVLEAMACSCPVITCQNSSLGEIAGDAALYVDPDDTTAMLKALLAVQEVSVRNELIVKGQHRALPFTWRRMAETLEKALTERILDGLEPHTVSPSEPQNIPPTASPSPAISVQIPASKREIGVTFEVCSACQFSCEHCAHEGLMALDPNYHMSMTELKYFIKVTEESDYLATLTVHGPGEPLLWKHLIEGLTLLKESKAIKAIHIVSNGKHLPKVLPVLDLIDSMRISLYPGSKTKIINHPKVVYNPHDVFINKQYPAAVPCTCLCGGPMIYKDMVLPYCGPPVFDALKRIGKSTDPLCVFKKLDKFYADGEQLSGTFQECAYCWANSNCSYVIESHNLRS